MKLLSCRRMPQNPFDDKSTLVQVMAWCHQATSHYLSQCWPRSMSQYGVTRPHWVKPCHAEFILRNNNFARFITSQYWDGSSHWNPPSWKTRTCLFCTVNIITADDLATQGARPSAAMVQTMLSIPSYSCHCHIINNMFNASSYKDVCST